MSDSKKLTVTGLWQKDHGEVLCNYINSFHNNCVDFSEKSHGVAKVLDGLSDNTYTRSLESIFTSIDAYINGQFEVLSATLEKELKKNADISSAFNDKGNEEAVEAVKVALSKLDAINWEGADLQDGGSQPTQDTVEYITKEFMNLKDYLQDVLSVSKNLINDMDELSAVYTHSVANFHESVRSSFSTILDELTDSKKDINERIASVGELINRIRQQSADDATEARTATSAAASAKKEKVEMPDALA